MSKIRVFIVDDNKRIIKQFFCKHIMKDVSQEETRVTREIVPGAIGESLHQYYQYYAYHYKCIKCEKEVIREHRFLIRNPKDDEGK